MGVVHPEELKKEVVAKWQTGISKKALAREYKLDAATVRRWCDDPRLVEAQTLPLFRRISPEDAPTPKAMIDAGAKILELVSGLVDAQLEACRLALDPEWLRSREPDDLHRWFNEWSDRTVGILDAISRGEELRQQDAEDRRAAEAARLAGPAGNDGNPGDSASLGYGRPPPAT